MKISHIFRHFYRVLRTIAFSAIIIVATLYVMVYVAISLPWVQDKIRLTAERELSAFLGSAITIGNVDITPSGEVRLTDVLIPSPNGEKCVAVQRLAAGIDFSELIFKRHICFTYAELVGLDGYLVQKKENEPWNIQFIIDALKPKDPNKPPTKFDITLRNVVIRKGAVAIDKQWLTKRKEGIDFNHLRFENLNADLTLPRLANDDFTIDLRRLAVSERSGFELETLSCLVHLTPQELNVDNLFVKLPGTQLEIPKFNLLYDGYNNIVKSLKSRKYKLDFDNVIITPYDFRAFFPKLISFQNPIKLTLNAEGTINDIMVDRLSVNGSYYGIQFESKFTINDLSIKDKFKIKADKIALSVSPECVKTILGFLPDLPEKTRNIILALNGITLDANGLYGGKSSSFDARLATGIGALETKGSLSWQRKGLIDVDAILKTPGFEIGTLLADNRFGNIVVDAEGQLSIGNGDINGHASVDVPSFQFNGHNVSNLLADITKSGKDISGNLSVQSDPVTVSINGNGTVNGKNSVIDASIDISRFAPGEIGLAGMYGYVFSGNVVAAVNGIDPASFTGNFTADNVKMECPKGPFEIKHLSVSAAEGDAGTRQVEIRSDFLDADIAGKFDVAKLSKAATALAARAMPALLPPHLTEADYSSQFIDFNIALHDTEPIIHFFNLPIKPLTNIQIEGNMHGSEGKACLYLKAPYIQQGKDKLIRNTYAEILLDGDNHSATINAGTLLPGKNDSDVSVFLNATGIDDLLQTKVFWDLHRQKDYKGEVAMKVAFEREPLTGEKSFIADIIPSTFSVADAKWNIAQGSIKFAKGILDVNNVSVSHNKQFVNINGRASKSPDDKIIVNLADIDLDYIFETLNINYVTFGGRATGRAVASSVFDFKNMDAHTENLHVDNLMYNGGILGDADLTGTFNPKNMKVGIGAEIAEKGKHVATVDGGIWIARDSLAFAMNTDKINVKFLQPFMQAFSSDIEGRASGKVNLFGTFSDIDMTGRVYADSLRMKVDYTQVYYHGSDSVIMTPGRIFIPKFRIYDDYGQSALVTGEVNHRYFHDPSFEFKVREAKDLLCYNTTANDNPDWYGKIFGRGGGTIFGRPGFVGIRVDMTIGPKSVFNFILNDTEAVADYQFLEFTDKKGTAELEEKIRLQAQMTDTVPDFVKLFRQKQKQAVQQEEIPSVFSLDIRASVNPDAEMILVMDPVGGDKIRAHGSGALQIGYSTDSDEMTMYGKYTLADGFYNFTLQDLIIKDFTIRPGSNISFNGDPLKAILDINAIYRVNTSLTDLDKSFANDRDLNRTNVPVDAVLSVHGDMQAPDITFDIELPTLTSDVARKVKSIISTDDMMSRQIIYLLALNRFYTPEYMGSSSNGGEWASVASATVTSQLTNMLSQLTDKFTLAPSLRSDKGDFSDMEVDVALSSRLLNNRLLINGNLGYRDPATSNTTFIGDFDVEYLLNRSGNLRLKAYNHFNDQNYYLKSALTTQGIGVVYRKEFDDFFKFLRRRKKSKSANPDSVPTQSKSN